jgi:hypothetical protein
MPAARVVTSCSVLPEAGYELDGNATITAEDFTRKLTRQRCQQEVAPVLALLADQSDDI